MNDELGYDRHDRRARAFPFPPGLDQADPRARRAMMRAAWKEALMSEDQESRGRRRGRGHHGRPEFGGWGGPGPFRGGPFGGPFGRGPGRQRASRGDVRLAVLALLLEEPRHGYQLIQDIAERSHDQWRPSPGSIYPALSVLQDEGLIDDEKVDGRRVFSLTDAGREYVAERSEEMATVFAAFDEQENAAGGEDLRSLIGGLAIAASQVYSSGKGERAEAILGKARRDLYAVLAEDDQAGAES